MTQPSAPVPPSAPLPARPTPWATVAMVAAIVVVIANLITQLVSYLAPWIINMTGSSYALYGIAASAGSVVLGLLGVAALVLGIIAVRRPGESRLRVGIAIGVGGATLIAVVGGALISGVVNLFFAVSGF
jgi:hypothetical protein